mmetsp:Transcript_9648/g.20754  ORF Transcript_9648/g.20754 Transcript_9648/m.20754 type:complete len:81 (-) Transcript_9648:653-895(-)
MSCHESNRLSANCPKRNDHTAQRGDESASTPPSSSLIEAISAGIILLSALFVCDRPAHFLSILGGSTGSGSGFQPIYTYW